MMESQVEMDQLEHGTKGERKAAADKLGHDSEKMKHPNVQKSGDSAYVGGDMGRYVNKLDVSAPLLSCCVGSGSTHCSLLMCPSCTNSRPPPLPAMPGRALMPKL